jgi:hypothetical protein
MLADKVRYWLLWVWFCLESGQFLETHSHWGAMPLFWPFWVCFFISLTLTVELLSTRLG